MKKKTKVIIGTIAIGTLVLFNFTSVIKFVVASVIVGVVGVILYTIGEEVFKVKKC